MGDVDVVA